MREVSGWWAVHLSSWASPAGHLVGARRVGARLVAGGIVGGIASQSCWRLRGEPRAVDSLAVDRRTACMRWCLWAVQQTIHGGYSCGVGSPRGPEVGAAQARHGGHVRGDGRGADGACVVQPGSGHPTVSASIVCSYDQLDTIAMQARNCSSKHESRFGCEVLENLPLATRNDVARSTTQKNIQFSHNAYLYFSFRPIPRGLFSRAMLPRQLLRATSLQGVNECLSGARGKSANHLI